MKHTQNTHLLQVGIGALLSIIALLVLPSLTHAYYTTNQTEIDLDNGSGLFLIEYKFGHPAHTVTMPLIAQEGATSDDFVVSYEIRDKDSDVYTNGSSAGIVLSTADMGTDFFYRTSLGFLNTFTLAVFFTPSESGNYYLQVTSLPFVFDDTQELQLNPSELKYYKTDRLEL